MIPIPAHLEKQRLAMQSQTSANEAKFLYNAVLDTPCGDVVEIGSATGGTTLILIEAAAQRMKHVYSVDPYPVELENKVDNYNEGTLTHYKSTFKANILNGQYKNVTQFNVNLKDCIDNLPRFISVAFIDGLHELDNAVREFHLIYPLIAPEGWLCVHDIGWGKGQVSKTEDTGLWKLISMIDVIQLFKEFMNVDQMFCGRK